MTGVKRSPIACGARVGIGFATITDRDVGPQRLGFFRALASAS